MYIPVLLMLLVPIVGFSQDSATLENTSYSGEKLPLKFRGFSTKGAVAIIVSNKGPAFTEIRTIINDLVKNDFRIALVPDDYDYDLSQLTTNNSPFVPEIKFVLKISVHNKIGSEQLIKTTVSLLRLADQKIISNDFATPRSNPQFLFADIQKMLVQVFPKTGYINPGIVWTQGDIFSFPKKDFPGLRRGDEIHLRYKESRQGDTESIAIVQRMSNDMALAKDLSKKVAVGDEVLRNSPKRNRFYINLGAVVPTLGERILTAQLDGNIWQDAERWPVGFKIEGEYERFLPFQLVSTTAFGINVDRTLHTYLMTGIGYRIFVNTWEFTPYFRLGLVYNAIGLRSTTSSDLQGFALNIGFALGINVVKRIGNSLFTGLDLGVQYFPLNVVSVLTDSKKVDPQWKNNGVFTDNFSMTELYPYLSIKVGWIF